MANRRRIPRRIRRQSPPHNESPLFQNPKIHLPHTLDFDHHNNPRPTIPPPLTIPTPLLHHNHNYNHHGRHTHPSPTYVLPTDRLSHVLTSAPPLYRRHSHDRRNPRTTNPTTTIHANVFPRTVLPVQQHHHPWHRPRTVLTTLLRRNRPRGNARGILIPSKTPRTLHPSYLLALRPRRFALPAATERNQVFAGGFTGGGFTAWV